jgi:hypothetical protein
MPETEIISNQAPQFRSEIEGALADGWIPDEFYGPNGIEEVNKQIRHYFIKFSDQEKQEREKKNAEVLLEPNPNSSEETYKITVVLDGKTLIFENCKPKKSNANQ